MRTTLEIDRDLLEEAVRVTKSSVAAAAASLLAPMGLALVYASREGRLGAARSAA